MPTQGATTNTSQFGQLNQQDSQNLATLQADQQEAMNTQMAMADADNKFSSEIAVAKSMDNVGKQVQYTA